MKLIEPSGDVKIIDANQPGSVWSLLRDNLLYFSNNVKKIEAGYLNFLDLHFGGAITARGKMKSLNVMIEFANNPRYAYMAWDSLAMLTLTAVDDRSCCDLR
jgi:hypothetical protein